MPLSEADETLFEIVESGRLVFFTGAGASADLWNVRKESFPGWPKLLKSVREERKKRNRPAANDSLLETFLTEDADGQMLIEAASILREGFETEFDELVTEHLTPAPVEEQDKDSLARHRQKQDLLLRLHPRGIVTVNVDDLHERHLQLRARWDEWNFADALRSGSDLALRKALVEIGERPFLVKAHGTYGHTIAFDFQAYRRLLSQSPVYQMFMMNLFSNFQIVFLGFGLSDLDFDFFLQSQALAFGEPIRKHVALVKRKAKDKALQRRAALLSKRFGILFLWYREHSEIPGILERAGRTPGSRLKGILQRCLDHDDKARSRAHYDLTNLGPAGKHVAVLAIEEEVRRMLPGTKKNWFKLSEYVYSLGKIDSPLEEDRQLCREILLRSLQETGIKEVAAHAILALEKLAQAEDADLLQELFDRSSFWQGLRDLPEAPDPQDRVPAYLKCLILRLRAKSLAKS